MLHLPVMAKHLCLHYWISYTFYCKKAVLKLEYYTHEFPVLTGIMNSLAHVFIQTDLGKVAGFLVQAIAMMKY
jgi:hypothetical protein